ncbi:helix-turn-helix domain-containing protein [Limnoglobus roseus]|uniref:AraC family transcriptional regulator n=1 Tax=Limnoglobus roseus TaxID=2598579 RepID=A0A5C1AAC3_9BACT|nr:helix-turn-helix domain-containing protein [Limnoglobus roseus]QEL14976.1 AraC family transcriptional regulator [Limnoglobus roseus]
MPQTLHAKDWFHKDGFPLAVERREPQTPFDLHVHDFSELVVVTGGRGMHKIEDEAWPLSAGDVFVVKGDEAHEYCELDDLNLINVLYLPDRLYWDSGDLLLLPVYHALFTLEPQWRRRHNFNSRLHLPPAEIGHVLGLIDQLDAELKARAPGFGFMATALYMQLVGLLSRAYGRSRNPDTQALLRMARTITHLETHYADGVELDDLADMAHMSRRTFLRTFQAATGQSPIAYLIQIRVRRAADLLRTTGDAITDIAFAVGFQDSNYFARQFRQLMGTTPRDYRTANRP